MGLKDLIRNNRLIRNFAVKINPFNLIVPPGHFYSPIPDVNEIRKKENLVFDTKKEVKAIDLNDSVQLNLIGEFRKHYGAIPFEDHSSSKFRYHYNNEMYSHSSAVLLYSMLLHLKPNRIIEVGSGYTSALMLDVNNIFLENKMKLTFIEPYPKRLKSLLKSSDYSNVTIIEEKLENVDTSIFSQLQENDILFIDSTHVSKIGSDVNTILFEILPLLNKNVFIHFHDILYPFEYPKEWIYSGQFWNEAYMLKAFLMYNDSFKIHFFNTYATMKFEDSFKDMPLFTKNMGGCIWLKKEK